MSGGHAKRAKCHSEKAEEVEGDVEAQADDDAEADGADDAEVEDEAEIATLALWQQGDASCARGIPRSHPRVRMAFRRRGSRRR